MSRDRVLWLVCVLGCLHVRLTGTMTTTTEEGTTVPQTMQQHISITDNETGSTVTTADPTNISSTDDLTTEITTEVVSNDTTEVTTDEFTTNVDVSTVSMTTGPDSPPCDSNPCFNNATCLPEVNNVTCVCVPGYTGLFCETDMDECSSSPCSNNATCTEGIDTITCTCIDGFTGTLCQTNIDECASQPCLNSGSCTDLTNGFLCQCTDDYYGPTCEIKVGDGDDCDNSTIVGVLVAVMILLVTAAGIGGYWLGSRNIKTRARGYAHLDPNAQNTTFDLPVYENGLAHQSHNSPYVDNGDDNTTSTLNKPETRPSGRVQNEYDTWDYNYDTVQ